MQVKRGINTRKLILLALLTVIIIILQLLGSFIRFGPFSISLVLLPIVVGAAFTGIAGGAWLGFAFGAAVLISGDASFFLTINPVGTLITLLVRGALAGLFAGLIYNIFSGKNKVIGALAAAIVCPLVNTGLFVVGMYIFFFDTIAEWSAAAGSAGTVMYIFTGMIGLNFLFELGLNVILCPVIVRLIQHGQKSMTKVT